MIVDIVGMKRLLLLAFLLHLVGIVFTVFSTGFLSLYISTLFIGIANGLVEAACNPLVTTIYPDNKTTKLNHFHFWFPAGIVMCTLFSFGFANLGWGWTWQVDMMLLRCLYAGSCILSSDFLFTSGVSSGVSDLCI